MLLGKYSFLFITYCPAAVASQRQGSEAPVRHGDCRVRAGHGGRALPRTRRKRCQARLCNSSFTLRLGPRCWCRRGREGAHGRKCWGLLAPGARPASVERSWGQSSPPSPTQQNCCCCCRSPVLGQPGFALSRCCLLNFGTCWSSTPPALVKPLVFGAFSRVCVMIFVNRVAFLVGLHHGLPRPLQAEDSHGRSFKFPRQGAYQIV